MEAFQQWEELIGLICSCDDAIIRHRIIYDHFIDIFEVEIEEIPGEFFWDIVSKDCYIYVKLKNLFRSILSSKTDGRLKAKVTRFKHAISEKYNWDFTLGDEDSEDEHPVIVDLETSEVF